MPSLKPPKELLDTIRSFQVLKKDASEATNAANRKKTELKNIIVEYLRSNGLPAGTVILADGFEYSYATTESTYIDPEQWYRMFQSGRITEQEFLSALSVGKGEAKKIIGQDQVETLSITEKGVNADIRIRDDPDYHTDKQEPVVMVPATVTKPAAKIGRQIQGVTKNSKPLKRLVRL
jgi:hypothetical protein